MSRLTLHPNTSAADHSAADFFVKNISSEIGTRLAKPRSFGRDRVLDLLGQPLLKTNRHLDQAIPDAVDQRQQLFMLGRQLQLDLPVG